MNRYILFFALGLAVWLAPLACYHGQSAPEPRKAGEKKADHDKFCVTIWPKSTRVQIGVEFDVNLRVTNATTKLQSFDVIAPAWDDNWTTDNKRISLEATRGGFSNRVSPIKLAPGESYEDTVHLMVKKGPPESLTSFRMGFSTEFLSRPIPEPGASPPGKHKPTIYWSNRVVLGIKPGKEKSGADRKK